MKRTVLTNLELGIINGDNKRQLENYIDQRAFRQRKSFDEYYCEWDEIELELDVNDLMLLSESCNVEVGPKDITLTSE